MSFVGFVLFVLLYLWRGLVRCLWAFGVGRYVPGFSCLGFCIFCFVMFFMCVLHFLHRYPWFFPADSMVFPHFGHFGFLYIIFGASFMISIFSRFSVGGVFGFGFMVPYAITVSPGISFLMIFLKFPVGSYAARWMVPVWSAAFTITCPPGMVFGVSMIFTRVFVGV